MHRLIFLLLNLLSLVLCASSPAVAQTSNLRVTAEAIPSPHVRLGDAVTIRISVTNLGPDISTNLAIGSLGGISHFLLPDVTTCPTGISRDGGPDPSFFGFTILPTDVGVNQTRICEMHLPRSISVGESTFTALALPFGNGSPVSGQTSASLTIDVEPSPLSVPSLTNIGLYLLVAAILLVASLRLRRTPSEFARLPAVIAMALFSLPTLAAPPNLFSSVGVSQTGAALRTAVGEGAAYQVTMNPVAFKKGDLEVFVNDPGDPTNPIIYIPEATPAEKITLNIPGHGNLVATLTDYREFSQGGFEWVGQMPDDQRIVLTSINGKIRAQIFSGRESFVVFPEGTGHRLVKLDPAFLHGPDTVDLSCPPNFAFQGSMVTIDTGGMRNEEATEAGIHG